VQFDPRYQRARQEAGRRLPLTLIVVIVLVLIGVFGWDYIQRAVNPPATSTTTTQMALANAAVQYNLPEGWQVAGAKSTPFLATPEEILSVGTFPMQAGGTVCAHMPEVAMDDLGPDDALVGLQERSPAGDSFTPRPSSFGPLLTGITPGDACIDEDERDDVGTLLWHAFRDGDRGFYLLVVMGSEVTEETRQQTVGLLDSFSFGG
jgi:hypothetical protein